VALASRKTGANLAVNSATLETGGLMFQSVVIMVATIAVAVGCAAIVFRVMGARQEQQREALR
jgi:hypothetical protein